MNAGESDVYTKAQEDKLYQGQGNFPINLLFFLYNGEVNRKAHKEKCSEE